MASNSNKFSRSKYIKEIFKDYNIILTLTSREERRKGQGKKNKGGEEQGDNVQGRRTR